jgi:hypothetical protein
VAEDPVTAGAEVGDALLLDVFGELLLPHADATSATPANTTAHNVLLTLIKPPKLSSNHHRYGEAAFRQARAAFGLPIPRPSDAAAPSVSVSYFLASQKASVEEGLARVVPLRTNYRRLPTSRRPALLVAELVWVVNSDSTPIGKPLGRAGAHDDPSGMRWPRLPLGVVSSSC